MTTITNALEPAIFSVIRTLTTQPTYVVGGYVRDFLGGQASPDIDITVVGPEGGLELARRLANYYDLGPDEVQIYPGYGTARVATPEGVLELVTARAESYDGRSRNPQVRAGSFRDDILRRDFTINTLAIALHDTVYGQLVDECGGLADLNKGVLRTPLAPDQTLRDDPLRILRAIRFAARFKLTLDSDLRLAIGAQTKELQRLVPERIGEEMSKILSLDTAHLALELMQDLGVLNYLLPELSRLDFQPSKPPKHKNNFRHVVQVLKQVIELGGDLDLRWLALFHDVGKYEARTLTPGGWHFHGHEFISARLIPVMGERFKLSQKNIKRLIKLTELHHRPIQEGGIEMISDSMCRRLLNEAGSDLEDLLLFCRADITTSNTAKLQRYRAKYDQLVAKIYQVEQRDQIRNWQPAVDGHMLMERYDLPPGPLLGQMKAKVKTAVLAGQIVNEPEVIYEFLEQEFSAQLKIK